MAENTYNEMTPDVLQTWAENFYAQVAIGTPNTYGLSAEQLTAIDTSRASLGAAITNQTNYEAEFHAYVAAKRVAKRSLLSAIQSAAATIYNNAALTDQQIAASGLAIHKTGKTNITPVQPTSLVAVGCQSGNSLEWSRSTNDEAVTFVVERQSATGSWEYVASVGKTRFEDGTATPGATYTYRVFATIAGRNSIPSNLSTVYPTSGGGGETLEVAA